MYAPAYIGRVLVFVQVFFEIFSLLQGPKQQMVPTTASQSEKSGLRKVKKPCAAAATHGFPGAPANQRMPGIMPFIPRIIFIRPPPLSFFIIVFI